MVLLLLLLLLCYGGEKHSFPGPCSCADTNGLLSAKPSGFVPIRPLFNHINFWWLPILLFFHKYYDTPPPSPPHAKPCVLLPCSSFHPNTASQNFPSDLQIKHFTGHPDCEQTRFWKYRNSRICRRWTIFLQDHCCEIVSRVHRRILRRVFRGVFRRIFRRIVRGNLRRIFRRNLRRVLRKGAPETAAAAPLWQAKYRCRP